MRRSVVFYLLNIAIFCHFTGPLNKSHRLWQDDVPIVKNTLDPLHGDVTLGLKEELSIGSEENEKTAFYRNITFTVDDAGKYYIVDIGINCVQLFDPDGKYLRTIGRPGQGPGEFQNPGRVKKSQRS